MAVSVNSITVSRRPNWLLIKQIKQKIQLARADFAKSFSEGVYGFATFYAIARAKHPTGNLSKSLELINSINRPNFIRYDVSTKIPYGAWTEYGRTSPIGLPYSSPKARAKYNRDYSLTNFKGLRYLRGAKARMLKKDVMSELITTALMKRLREIK